MEKHRRKYKSPQTTTHECRSYHLAGDTLPNMSRHVSLYLNGTVLHTLFCFLLLSLVGGS